MSKRQSSRSSCPLESSQLGTGLDPLILRQQRAEEDRGQDGMEGQILCWAIVDCPLLDTQLLTPLQRRQTATLPYRSALYGQATTRALPPLHRLDIVPSQRRRCYPSGARGLTA